MIYTSWRKPEILKVGEGYDHSIIKKFATTYRNTPDIFQMTIPNLAGNTKGYFAPKADLQDVGDRVEGNVFQCDFNEKMYEKETTIARTQKLPTLGGAIAAFISVDVYSGYVHGHLVMNLANQIDHVRWTVETYRQEKMSIKSFAADQGIITQSQFQVFVPEVHLYLRKEGIGMKCGEAYRHDNGLSHSERAVRAIKELIRFAIYVLSNPNFSSLGFTRKNIFQLWGELFY
jgi:hypothetical protein